jgi:hypothetical protein
MTKLTCSFFRWALRFIPLFAFFVRMRLNIEMIVWGKQTATEGAKLNDDLTLAANQFMESQIHDPVLREKLRPSSKCGLTSTPTDRRS